MREPLHQDGGKAVLHPMGCSVGGPVPWGRRTKSGYLTHAAMPARAHALHFTFRGDASGPTKMLRGRGPRVQVGAATVVLRPLGTASFRLHGPRGRPPCEVHRALHFVGRGAMGQDAEAKPTGEHPEARLLGFV